jgi:ATP-binding cassette subfamily B protein
MLAQLRPADVHHQTMRCLAYPILFTGTLAENIRLGKPDATDDEIEKAARDAALGLHISFDQELCYQG